MFFYLQVDSDYFTRVQQLTKMLLIFFPQQWSCCSSLGEDDSQCQCSDIRAVKTTYCRCNQTVNHNQKACLSPVFSLLQPSIDQLLLSLRVLYWSLWAFWHFSQCLEGLFFNPGLQLTEVCWGGGWRLCPVFASKQPNKDHSYQSRGRFKLPLCEGDCHLTCNDTSREPLHLWWET